MQHIQQDPQTQEDAALRKLTEIAGYLERMDKRDRVRTYGAMVHTALAFIPTLFFVLSAWYLYAHGTELMSALAGEAAKQAAAYSTSGMDSLLNRAQEMINGSATSAPKGGGDFRVR